MKLDKVKLSKSDNKQLGKKAIRVLQLNLRLCIFLLLFLISVIFIVRLNRKLYEQPKHLSLHQYVRSFFNDPYKIPFKNNSNADDYNDDEFDLIWSEETVELFQDQLGIIVESEPTMKAINCQLGEEFIVSALPGVDDEDLGDVMWQYLSLIALESQTVQFNDDGQKLMLKAFFTEQMRAKMDQLFEGLPFRTLSNLPSTCYNLKYAQIIGNKTPIRLKEITPTDTPLLLDPKAKRVKEIAQLFGSKMKPFLRFKREVMLEIEQEFLVTKTIQEVEASRETVNFVGVYITTDDKLPVEFYEKAMNFHRKSERTIFMIICDVETLTFCHETFDGPKAIGDVRILRKSVDIFDFALLTSCNSTIVSNDYGVLHALLNGGDTSVHRPEATADPEFYTPWVLSENLPSWYAVD